MFRLDNAVLRCLGIFLVTNSHLDQMYPWPALGTGGSLGNAIFFMMSGYGLAASWANHTRPFVAWYWRRILRIYPSLLIVALVLGLSLGQNLAAWGIGGYVHNFVWPTYAWFVGALMLFYIPLYVIIRRGGNRPKIFLGILAGLFLPYFVWYFGWMDLSRYTIEGPTYFKWIFYFQTMLFGASLAARPLDHHSRFTVHGLLLAALLALYFLFGYLVHHVGYFTKIQFLVHFITFPILYLLVVWSRSSPMVKWLFTFRPVVFLVTLVSSATLEIYLLQWGVYSNRFIVALPFPLNVLVFWIVVIALGFLFSKAAELIRRGLMPRRASEAG